MTEIQQCQVPHGSCYDVICDDSEDNDDDEVDTSAYTQKPLYQRLL